MSILDQYDADRAAQQAEAHHQFMESVRRDLGRYAPCVGCGRPVLRQGDFPVRCERCFMARRDPEWAVARAEKERERAEDHARGELGGAA